MSGARFENAREFPAGTRTAADAAAAIGCDVGAICKSLVFRVGDEPLLIIASGANRVDEARFGAQKADAAFAREQTGFAIGGVPPLGHTVRLATFMDEDLLQYETIWAAAGTPYAVFAVAPRRLQTAVNAKIIKVT